MKNTKIMIAEEDNAVETAGITSLLAESPLYGKKLMNDLNRTNAELRERTKEFNCLYEISKINEYRNTGVEETIKILMKIIPDAFQYPDIVYMRFSYCGFDFKSANYRKNLWKIKKDIKVSDMVEGFIEIGYTNRRPVLGDWPFSREEMNLIEIIVEQIQNIIEKKSTDERLRKKAALLDLSYDAVIVRDMEDRILFWNRGAEVIYGYNESEAIGRIAPVLLKTVFPEPLRRIKSDLMVRGYWEGILNHKTSTGRHVIVSSRWGIQLDSDGNQVGTFEVNRDITEIKTYEKALRNYELSYQTVFENTGNATIIFDKDLKIIKANRQFEDLTGYTAEEIHDGGRRLGDLIKNIRPDMLKTKSHSSGRDYFNDNGKNETFIIYDKFGNSKNVIITIDDIPDSGLRVASLIDMTERVHLTNELLMITEREQSRIGRDLHDDLGQYLTGISLLCSALKEKVKSKKSLDISEIDRIEGISIQAKEIIRSIVKGMTFKFIAEHGILSLLNDLSIKIKDQFGINCGVMYNLKSEIKNEILSTNLFYIIKEGINNAVKHASAKNISVSLNQTNDDIIVNIEDDGTGIPEGIDIYKSLGLRLMNYRAKMINASFSVKKRHCRGTIIECVIHKSISEE